MKRFIAHGWFVVVLGLVFVTGCANYYRVTDPQSGKVFYTKEIDTNKGGAVKMKDARSGSSITLQSSEVKEISEDEYEKGISDPVSKPAPAPAVPSPAPGGTN